MTLIDKARQNRATALTALRQRESNVFSDTFGRPRRDRPDHRPGHRPGHRAD